MVHFLGMSSQHLQPGVFTLTPSPLLFMPSSRHPLSHCIITAAPITILVPGFSLPLSPIPSVFLVDFYGYLSTALPTLIPSPCISLCIFHTSVFLLALSFRDPTCSRIPSGPLVSRLPGPGLTCVDLPSFAPVQISSLSEFLCPHPSGKFLLTHHVILPGHSRWKFSLLL